MANGAVTGELELRNGRCWSAWIGSLVVHFLAITALVYLSAGDSVVLPIDSNLIVTPLVYRQPVRNITDPPVRISHIPKAIRMPGPAPAPKVQEAKQFQAVLRESSHHASIQVPEAEVQVQTPLVPARLETASLPRAAAPPVAKASVKTDVFGTTGNSPSGTVPSPRLEVHTGGFGGTDGAQGQAPGAGNGKGGGVHTGGFGDSTGSGGGAAGSGGSRAAMVADAGFGTATAPAPAPRRTQVAASESPVEVVWKPRPVYTEEARARKLEGNVTLEVVFRANGQVQVIRVTRGLGSGLDESARAAAEQIRFHPAKKDGIAIDRAGVIEITFELS